MRAKEKRPKLEMICIEDIQLDKTVQLKDAERVAEDTHSCQEAEVLKGQCLVSDKGPKVQMKNLNLLAGGGC